MQGPSWRARGETGWVGARIRLPMRVLLPCVAVCLVACGAVAIGAVCVLAAGGYVLRQADDGLRACASSMLSHGPVAVAGSGAVPGQAQPVPCRVELLSVTGQVLIPAPAGAGGPAIPASGPWLAAHLAGPVTVPGSGPGGRWRVAITAVHYQAQRILFVFGPDDLRYLISGPGGHGSRGMLVIMTGLAGTGQAAADYAAAAGTVLVLLAAAAFAVTRRNSRRLRQAARLAADAGRTRPAGPGTWHAWACSRTGIPGGTAWRRRESASGCRPATRPKPRRAGRRLTWQGIWSRHACSCAGRPPLCTGSPSTAAGRANLRQLALTGCCNGLPVKSPGWKPSSKDCACVQLASPPGRTVGPIRPRPTRPPMPACRTPANRRPATTTQRDRLSSRPTPDRRFGSPGSTRQSPSRAHADCPVLRVAAGRPKCPPLR